MIRLPAARWLLLILLSLIAGGLLHWTGRVRPVFLASAVLAPVGTSLPPAAEIERLTSEAFRRKLAAGGHAGIMLARRPAAAQLILTAEAERPAEAIRQAAGVSQAILDDSVARQKAAFQQKIQTLEKRQAALQARLDGLEKDRLAARRAARTPPRPGTPDPALQARIEAIKTRRQYLIQRYPFHGEIPGLAAQIQQLEAQLRSRPVRARITDTGRVNALGRQIAETRAAQAILVQRILALSQAAQGIRPAWKVAQAAAGNWRPVRVEGWPWAAGLGGGILIVALVLIGLRRRSPKLPLQDGLWRAPSNIALEVVSPEESKSPAPTGGPALDDPLSREAAALYDRWLEITRPLYQPAPEPPRGLMDQLDPLLRETSAFLPKGHDTMARHLAATVLPGDLPTHVVHTVLMALLGAWEAGALEAHGRAVALAALFHDLAIVPRQAGRVAGATPALYEVGSEVGRLSVSLVRRIPDLPPGLVPLIESILIGMDEFRDAMWQNLSADQNLEPLAALLRQIDRFEKVMQKQKTRLDRRLLQRTAS